MLPPDPVSRLTFPRNTCVVTFVVRAFSRALSTILGVAERTRRGAIVRPSAASPAPVINRRRERDLFLSIKAKHVMSVLPVAVVGNDLVPFLRGRASDKRHDRFGLTHVENFVRNAGFDKD